MGTTRTKRAGQRSRTVREDWLAWIPNEMDQLFGDTRKELESSNFILSMSLDEALALCKQGEFAFARERAIVAQGLFNRLSVRVCHVVNAIREHGAHFGTLPNVTPLASSNFRSSPAQKVALMDSILAKVLFRERTRFFHKLHSLLEITEDLQKEARAILSGISEGATELSEQAWQSLEVVGYDLNTCMVETTILLKSFFCALPPEELDTFRQRLIKLPSQRFGDETGTGSFFDSE